MIFYESNGLVVAWDDATRCTVLRLERYAEGEELRKAIDSTLKLLEKRGANKLLTDSREMKVIRQEDQRWVDEDWLPRARVAGLAYNALVMPKSAIAWLTVDAMVKKVPVGEVEFGYFSDIEEAKSWLRSK